VTHLEARFGKGEFEAGESGYFRQRILLTASPVE